MKKSFIALSLLLTASAQATVLKASCQFVKILPGSELAKNINTTTNRNSSLDIRSETDFTIQYGNRVFSSRLNDKLKLVKVEKMNDQSAEVQQVAVYLAPHENSKLTYLLVLPAQINEMHGSILIQYLKSTPKVIAS